jgi:hypothetical protein
MQAPRERRQRDVHVLGRRRTDVDEVQRFAGEKRLVIGVDTCLGKRHTDRRMTGLAWLDHRDDP